MMGRILVIDEPDKHIVQTWGETANEFLGVLERESKLVKTLADAYRELEKGGIDLAIIHHYDFPESAELRKRSPNTRFAAYSGTLSNISDSEEGTLGWVAYDRFRKNYDFLIEDTSEDLEKILDKIDEDSK